jgi:hypothetical protein
MRILFYLVAVITALTIGDAVGFGGQYRQMAEHELKFINPFKRMVRFPAARSNGRASAIVVAHRRW